MRPIIVPQDQFPSAELSTYRYESQSIPSHNPNYPYLDIYPNIYHPYDPITGEYIKPLQPLERTQSRTLVPTAYNYNDNESDSLLMCCDCCKFKIPINCSTVSLFTNLILIAVFTIIKFSYIDPKTTSENTSALIEEIILILLFSAVFILVAIFLRYLCDESRRQPFISLFNCCISEEEEENRRMHSNNFNNYYSRDCNEQFV